MAGNERRETDDWKLRSTTSRKGEVTDPSGEKSAHRRACRCYVGRILRRAVEEYLKMWTPRRFRPVSACGAGTVGVERIGAAASLRRGGSV